MKKPSQLAFQMVRRGGKRKGAGRKKRLPTEPSHARRERIDFKKPMMITLKCAEKTPGLRTPKFLKWFSRIVKLAARKGLRVIQFAIEGNHIHLIVEADLNEALKRGMQSIIASLKWAFRTLFNYRGKVLRGRFHTLICATPTQVRNALRYVLFNHAKHCGMAPFIDAYSSGAIFDGIEKLTSERLRRVRLNGEVEVEEPRSWLLRFGWRRARV